MLLDDRAKLAVVGCGKRLHRLLHCGHQRSHNVPHDFFYVAADVTARRLHIGVHHACHHHLELFVPSAAFLLLLILFRSFILDLSRFEPRLRLDEAALLNNHINQRQNGKPRERASHDRPDIVRHEEYKKRRRRCNRRHAQFFRFLHALLALAAVFGALGSKHDNENDRNQPERKLPPRHIRRQRNAVIRLVRVGIAVVRLGRRVIGFGIGNNACGRIVAFACAVLDDPICADTAFYKILSVSVFGCNLRLDLTVVFGAGDPDIQLA